MNNTALQIDVKLQYFLVIFMVVCFCSIIGIIIGLLLEIAVGTYQTLHALYFGLVLQKDWAKQHLINIGIFIVVGYFLSILVPSYGSLAGIYLILVPLGMAVWYVFQVRQHYQQVSQLHHHPSEHEDILDADLDQL